MPIINFEKVRRYTNVPDDAARILARPEKQQIFNLSVHHDQGLLVQTDAYVVYYCTVRGPAKGGIRFWNDVTLEETAALAELMVWKTALTGIPFGGGKSGIRADIHKLTRFQKTVIMREFVHLLRNDIVEGVYIPAPDMGTNPTDMAIIFGETHITECVTGKPVGVGGLPGRLQATGRGVSTIVQMTASHVLNKPLEAVTVAIQGFGNVGSWTAHFLHSMGAKVVAVSDIDGGIANPKGLDVPALMAKRTETCPVAHLQGSSGITNEELLAMDVDILIPAAAGEVLLPGNSRDVRAKAIVEGANHPVVEEADEVLREKGVVVVPDILTNAGGVVASYVEWHKGKSGALSGEQETFDVVDKLLSNAFTQMLELSRDNRLDFRNCAMALAVGRIVQSMRERGWI
ncbi:MAG TPA: Glu/Leu/Phe/Val dehydrogenase [Planctomycetes bacterium]|nr:Glu/Leu/Phe/Val dehydrogenase [Planctomycetota bacterium]